MIYVPGIRNNEQLILKAIHSDHSSYDIVFSLACLVSHVSRVGLEPTTDTAVR